IWCTVLTFIDGIIERTPGPFPGGRPPERARHPTSPAAPRPPDIVLTENIPMPEQAMNAETPAADPLRTAADAMALAVQAAKDGAPEARPKVSEIMPAVGGFLSRLTYTTSYAVSYGVVFPTLLVARAVPKDNALVHGLVDGALAARDAVAGMGRAPAVGVDAGSAAHPRIIVPGEGRAAG